MGALDDLIRADMERQGARPVSSLQQLIDDDARAQQAPPEPKQYGPNEDPELEQYAGKTIELPEQRISADAPWHERLLENMTAGNAAVRADYQQRINSPAANAVVQHLNRLGSDPRYLAASGARAAALAAGPFGPAGIGAQAAIQGGVGAVQGALDRNAADPDSDALDLLAAGGRAAVPAAMGGAGGAMLARGFSGAANTVHGWADENRIKATGMPAGEVEAMGPSARAELAGGIEREGLHEGPGMLGFLPQPLKQYSRNGQALASRGGAQMRASEDAINQLPSPPSVDVGDTILAQRSEAARLQDLADTQANAPQARFRNQLAQGLENDAAAAGPNGELPWERALEQRRNLDANTNFGGLPGSGNARNAIRKEVAGELRGGIDDALNSPSVPPDLAQSWRQGRDQTALGLQVAEPALKAMNMRASEQVPMNMRQAVQQAGRWTRGNAALAGAERGIATANEGLGAASDLAGRTSGLWDWLRLKLRTGEDTTDASDIYRDVGRGPRNDFGGM